MPADKPGSRIYIELDPVVMDTITEIKTNVEKLMVDISKITADITAETDLIKSVATAIDGQKQVQAQLEAQVADLKNQIAALNDPTLQAAVDALDATVQSNSQLLRDAQGAITANTAST